MPMTPPIPGQHAIHYCPCRGGWEPLPCEQQWSVDHVTIHVSPELACKWLNALSMTRADIIDGASPWTISRITELLPEGTYE